MGGCLPFFIHSLSVFNTYLSLSHSLSLSLSLLPLGERERESGRQVSIRIYSCSRKNCRYWDDMGRLLAKKLPVIPAATVLEARENAGTYRSLS